MTYKDYFDNEEYVCNGVYLIQDDNSNNNK